MIKYLEMEDYPELSEWTLNAVISMLLRGSFSWKRSDVTTEAEIGVRNTSQEKLAAQSGRGRNRFSPRPPEEGALRRAGLWRSKPDF